MSTGEIESALREVKGLPAPVENWRVETGEDSTGNEAVWVWVTIEDKDLNWETRTKVRALVRDAVRREFGKQEPWVYVRFRGASETDE
jgi:hypothetical protein